MKKYVIGISCVLVLLLASAIGAAEKETIAIIGTGDTDCPLSG